MNQQPNAVWILHLEANAALRWQDFQKTRTDLLFLQMISECGDLQASFFAELYRILPAVLKFKNFLLPVLHTFFLQKSNAFLYSQRCSWLGGYPEKCEEPSYAEVIKTRLGIDVEQCPCCITGKMIVVLQFGANAPPRFINDKRKAMKIK